MSKVIYILSNNRSGSTLLDQLLGGHSSIVSLGEVHHLKAYVRQDRDLYDPKHPLDCSCGATIQDCDFWQATEKTLRRPLDSLRMHCRLHEPETARKPDAIVRYPRRLLHRVPALMRSRLGSRLYGAREVGADSFALFDAICEVSGATYVTDSSKSAVRFRALYNYAKDDVFGIWLVRDYRGVVFSKLKRGRDLDAVSREWAARLRFIDALTQDIPGDRLLRLRYEDLCRDPRAELERICRFLKLEFSEAMLDRFDGDTHHLGGSPSKFDRSRREIREDHSYVDRFSDEDLSRMREIVGEAASRWGYD